MTHEHSKPAEIRYCPYCGAPVEWQRKQGKLRPVCNVCGRVQFIDPKVAAGVFLEYDQRVLLVQRMFSPEKGKWSLPAGFVDGGEDPRQAAVRECAEETGLSVEVVDLMNVFYGRAQAASADLMLVYRVRRVGGDLRASDDAKQAAFFGPDELPPLAFESTLVSVRRWVESA
ncbi:MAG: NUDIX hydrolase [Anaerolineales bacterium]